MVECIHVTALCTHSTIPWIPPLYHKTVAPAIITTTLEPIIDSFLMSTPPIHQYRGGLQKGGTRQQLLTLVNARAHDTFKVWTLYMADWCTQTVLTLDKTTSHNVYADLPLTMMVECNTGLLPTMRPQSKDVHWSETTTQPLYYPFPWFGGWQKCLRLRLEHMLLIVELCCFGMYA